MTEKIEIAPITEYDLVAAVAGTQDTQSGLTLSPVSIFVRLQYDEETHILNDTFFLYTTKAIWPPSLSIYEFPLGNLIDILAPIILENEVHITMFNVAMLDLITEYHQEDLLVRQNLVRKLLDATVNNDLAPNVFAGKEFNDSIEEILKRMQKFLEG